MPVGWEEQGRDLMDVKQPQPWVQACVDTVQGQEESSQR